MYVKLLAGEDVPLYTRVEYQQSNERLLRLIERYDEMEADAFLNACSFYTAFPQERIHNSDEEEIESDESAEIV